MRRPIAPCACVLALITGAWVGQAYSLFAPPDPIAEAEASSSRTVESASRFYDAIDLFFRTGDATAVRDVVSPRFVDHVASLTAPGDRDGLLGYLASLRATHPTLRLAPHDVTAQGDRAVAQITLDGDLQGAVMGIPLSGLTSWPR